MYKLIMLFSIPYMGLCLGDNYYETYVESIECKGFLLECMHDLSSISEMSYIDDIDREWADDLWYMTNSYHSSISHATDLIYIYMLVNNPEDKLVIGEYIEKQIGFLIEDLEFGVDQYNKASYLIGNNSLSNFCDKIKERLRKCTKKLNLLDFE